MKKKKRVSLLTRLWYAYCDYYNNKYGCYPNTQHAKEQKLGWF